MILCSAIHHPEAKERDNLLHMLFNLIKRPDEDQRWGVKNLLIIFSKARENFQGEKDVHKILPLR